MCYLLEVSKTASQGTASALHENNDSDEALATLHAVFASAMINPDVQSCLCMIIEPNGAVIRNEYWVRPIFPEVPDEEPVE